MKIVPCNVCIKRFYRTYAHLDDEATEEQIIKTVQKEILAEQDEALCEDPDLVIEEHDIVLISPDFDAAWSEME